MAKLQRDIDPIRLEQAKQRTMTAVMERIQPTQPSPYWRRFLRPVLIPTMVLAFVLAVLFFPRGNTPIDNPVDINAYNAEKLAELTYLSGNFIGANLTVSIPDLTFLADTGETEFEQEDVKINFYFDTLRLYLEGIDFTQVVQAEELVDSEFDYLITFELNGKSYEFYVTLDGTNLTGELIVNGIVFTVTGKMEEKSNETSFELEAINGNNYVRIEYEYEVEDEIESEYRVHSRINGVETEQVIKVSHENDESEVEITDGDNEYKLKREVENGVTTYKLEYKINNVEGEARITETTDINGKSIFQYSVKEGDIEKDIERGKPDYDFDDDDDDDDFPGNGDPQNEDEEDSPGHDGSGNQSYPFINDPIVANI